MFVIIEYIQKWNYLTISPFDSDKRELNTSILLIQIQYYHDYYRVEM